MKSGVCFFATSWTRIEPSEAVEAAERMVGDDEKRS
jgi:hypothetical protein